MCKFTPPLRALAHPIYLCIKTSPVSGSEKVESWSYQTVFFKACSNLEMGFSIISYQSEGIGVIVKHPKWSAPNCDLLVKCKLLMRNPKIHTTLKQRWNFDHFKLWEQPLIRSNSRDLWALRHLIKVMRGHGLAKKDKDKDNDTDNDKDNPRDLWHLRHWLQFRQLRTFENLCYLTMNCDTRQHLQFLRCFLPPLL